MSELSDRMARFPTLHRIGDLPAMCAFGAELAATLLSGDVVVLDGPLGAGKTTLTQSIGAALRVRGPITSPTFVLSRVHPSLVDGPALVHVDAYRLGTAAELDDLDLQSSLDRAVTVIEWGAGKVGGLIDEYVEIAIDFVPGNDIGRRLELSVRQTVRP